MAGFTLPHDHGERRPHAEDLHRELMNAAHFAAAAEIFKQLSDPTRVRIFWLLSHQEECVINIAALLEMSSPAVSHHLRSLTESGLLVSRRDGKEVYYKAADTAQIRLLHEIVEQVMEIACPEKAVDFQASQEEIIRRVHDDLTEQSFRARDDRGAFAQISDEYHHAQARLQAGLRRDHRRAHEKAPHGGGRRACLTADAGRCRGHRAAPSAMRARAASPRPSRRPTARCRPSTANTARSNDPRRKQNTWLYKTPRFRTEPGRFPIFLLFVEHDRGGLHRAVRRVGFTIG